jgi:hypothetical protein
MFIFLVAGIALPVWMGEQNIVRTMNVYIGIPILLMYGFAVMAAITDRDWPIPSKSRKIPE